jgi:hypothetical protein
MVKRETSNVPPPRSEDEDVSRVFGLLVKTVRDCSGEGLIHDAERIETANDTSGLSLRIVTVGRCGDDGTCDGAAEIRLCDLLHLGKDHRRYFFRRPEQLYEFTCNVGLSTRVLTNCFVSPRNSISMTGVLTSCSDCFLKNTKYIGTFILVCTPC